MTMPTATQHPRHYRDLLRQVEREATAGNEPDAKQLLLGNGFIGIEALRERATLEEQEAKPAKLTAAELELAKARNAVEQAEAGAAAELQKFHQIEHHRALLHRLEQGRVKVPTLPALKADLATAEATLALEIAETYLAVAPDNNATLRFDNAVFRLASLNAQIKTREACAMTIILHFSDN